MFGRNRIKGPTIRGSIAGLWMIVCTVTGCTFPFPPLYIFGGFLLAVEVSAGSLLHPLAGFLLAVGGNSKAGSRPSSGCRCRGKVKVVERMNILVLEGPLPAQTGQGIQMFRSGCCVGKLKHGVVDVHRQFARMSAPSDKARSDYIA